MTFEMTFKMTFEMTFESNNDGTNKLDDPEGLSLSVAVIGQLMRQRGPPLDLVKCLLWFAAPGVNKAKSQCLEFKVPLFSHIPGSDCVAPELSIEVSS